MGIQDRDWYRQEQHERRTDGRRFQAERAPRNWLWITIFWLGLMAALYLLAKQFQHLTPANLKSGIAKLELTPKAKPVEPATRQLNPARPVANAERQATQHPVATAKIQAATTLYLCKSYGGGLFWSTGYCSSQQAFLERTATVPGGLTFEQQIQMADAQRLEAAALANPQPSPSAANAMRCTVLKRERDTIEGRYTNWQWQTVDVINADQTRMKGLRAEQARFGCPTQ